MGLSWLHLTLIIGSFRHCYCIAASMEMSETPWDKECSCRWSHGGLCFAVRCAKPTNFGGLSMFKIFWSIDIRNVSRQRYALKEGCCKIDILEFIHCLFSLTITFLFSLFMVQTKTASHLQAIYHHTCSYMFLLVTQASGRRRRMYSMRALCLNVRRHPVSSER